MSVRAKQKEVFLFVTAVIIMAAPIIAFLPSGSASAAEITTRSLTLQAGASAGGSQPSGVVNHLFSYTLPTAGTIKSIQFLYCTTADGTCTTPSGLSTTSATLGTQTGATFSSVVNTTNGAPYITSASGVSITANEAVTTQLLTVTNPDGTDCVGDNDNCSFFVRISSYTTTNATGSPVDNGVVAASVNEEITLTGIMPESLIFCTGGTISTTDGQPDCSTTSSGNIIFNQVFSPTSTSYATSQMAASTNAQSGYAITVNGTTLTAGSDTIPAMTSSATSSIGSGQFGMNLMANTTPAVGTAVTPAANGTDYKGEPTPSSGYDVTNDFKFVSGNEVADSSNGGASGTDAQIFTASYIVNVPGNQAPGTYTTTLTYICTPTF